MNRLLDPNKECVLIFTPEGGVLPHLVSQSIIARSLIDSGIQPVMVICNSLLKWCPTIGMYNKTKLADDEYNKCRDEICSKCIINSHFLSRHFGIPSIDFRTLLTEGLSLLINQILANAPDDLKTLEFDGVNFGKLTAREVVFAHKIYDFSTVPSEVRRTWLRFIETALTTYLLTQRILGSLPVGKIIYYNEYPSNLGALRAARKVGIPASNAFFAAAKGTDRQRIAIYQGTFVEGHQAMMDSWPKWRDLSLNQREIRYITDDLLTRFGATSVFTYSPARSGKIDALYESLKLDKERGTIVAYTSSMDEMSAYALTMDALDLPKKEIQQSFKDQAEWLLSLIEYVSSKNDLQLIIRIHPREGANKRENFASTHLEFLKSILPTNHPLCKIVWPEDKISSYDIAEIADLASTSWSTIGLEVARIGVPVVTSVKNYSFPEDDFLIFGGNSKSEFINNIDKTLNNTQRSLATILRAYRCFYYFQLANTFDASDIIPSPDFDGVPANKTPKEAWKVKEAVLGISDLSLINKNELYNNFTSEEEQLKILKNELLRITYLFICGSEKDASRNIKIVIDDNNSLEILIERSQFHVESSEDDIILISSNMIAITSKNYQGKRFSPLLVRLIKMINNDQDNKYSKDQILEKALAENVPNSQSNNNRLSNPILGPN